MPSYQFDPMHEFNLEKFDFITNMGIVIPITEEEWLAAEEGAKVLWSRSSRNRLRQGLANTKDNPYLVERSGYLGQLACGKGFNVYTDIDRMIGGDGGTDFILSDGRSGDVKTNVSLESAERHRCNFAKAKESEKSPLISLHSEIYIGAFLAEEDREAHTATIVLTGYWTREEILDMHKGEPPGPLTFTGEKVWYENGLKLPLGRRRYSKHYNYELPFEGQHDVRDLREFGT